LAEAETPGDQSVVNDIKSILIKYQEETKAQFEAIEKRLETMDKSVVEMSEQPKAQRKTGQAKIDFSKMTNFQKLKYNEENNKR